MFLTLLRKSVLKVRPLRSGLTSNHRLEWGQGYKLHIEFSWRQRAFKVSPHYANEASPILKIKLTELTMSHKGKAALWANEFPLLKSHESCRSFNAVFLLKSLSHRKDSSDWQKNFSLPRARFIIIIIMCVFWVVLVLFQSYWR